MGIGCTNSPEAKSKIKTAAGFSVIPGMKSRIKMDEVFFRETPSQMSLLENLDILEEIMTKRSPRKTKPTQLQQVFTALKILGKGTPKTIYAKIEKLFGPWIKAKRPAASVGMYLVKNKDDIFTKKDGFWTLKDTKKSVKPPKGKTAPSKPSGKLKDNGLYLVTLSPNIKIPATGFLFKIGESGDIRKRLIAYSACLPVETIHEICFYPVPPGVNLKRVEKEVTGELLGNENLGYGIFDHEVTIQRHYGNHQREWLKTLDIDPDSKNDIAGFIKIINGIVKATIANTPSSGKTKTN
jgi:hypothetical protein